MFNSNKQLIFTKWCIPVAIFGASLITIFGAYSVTDYTRDFSAAFPGEEELVLVTSASHMPRALRIFEQFGLRPLPAPCDFSIKVHPSGEHSPSRYFPSLDALRLWGKLLHEWAGEVTMGF